ncbi:hypothetical protein B7494_g5101 [Chlorociboria aeruginascens]|nr:hypothetical protein B7494_g5101 [Chlorociboria aeruginascens]
MKLLTTLFLFLAARVGANIIDKRVCGDNCARAVTGTAAGATHVASAKQDCSNFLITTTTLPSTTTETVYTTITETSGLSLRDINQVNSGTDLPAYAKRDAGTPVLPAYATACSGSAAYSSACSCFGIFERTVTSSYASIAVFVSATATTMSTSVASSSGVATSTSVYNPPIPSSYSGCMIDPNNATQLIELIDSNTGISFINADGIAVEAVDQVVNLTQYHFAPTKDGPAGVYDLVADDGDFVAVFDDGHVGFTPTSSDGQTYIASPKGNYVTSIWSVDCNGNILAGILGGSPFQLGLGGDSGNELFAEASNSLTKRQLPSWIEIAIFITELLHLRTDLGIDDPRCEDPSLTAVVQFGARPPESNGCGTPPFIFNSVPFLSCCNDHDLCYGTPYFPVCVHPNRHSRL